MWFHHRGNAIWEILRYICMKAFPSSVQGRLHHCVLPQEMMPAPKSSYLCATITGDVHPWLLVSCCCSYTCMSCCLHRIQLPLCYHCWWRTSLIVSVMLLQLYMYVVLFAPRPDATYFKVLFLRQPRSASVCACVRVCHTHFCEPERFHPTLPLDFKSTRAAHQAVVRQQQQR